MVDPLGSLSCAKAAAVRALLDAGAPVDRQASGLTILQGARVGTGGG